MKNRLLTLIIATILMLSCVVMSSCASISGILGSIKPGVSDDVIEDEDEGDTDLDDDGDDLPVGSISGGSSNEGSLGGDIAGGDVGGDIGGGSPDDDDNASDGGDTDADVEYIPGLSDSQSAADGLSSAQRALLSTVIVRATHDVYSGYSVRSDVVNGSGVIYTLDRAAGDAIIVTNYHVVYHQNSLLADRISDSIKIYLYGMESEAYAIDAKYIGGSMTEDIAVLRISGSDVIKNSCAVSAIIGDSAALSPTDGVLVVGNPEGNGISATEGIVSVSDETISMTAADGRTLINIRVIRLDAGVNQGNSGGGLYGEDGKLIGIVNAKKTGSEIDNIGWALPINRVRNLVDNILAHCDGESERTPKKAVVGITIYASAMGVNVDAESGDVIRYEIVSVQEKTETCAIKDEIMEGDRILYTIVDGVRLDADRVHKVTDHLLRARVGSTLVIGVEREGEAFEITLTLTEDNFVTIS